MGVSAGRRTLPAVWNTHSTGKTVGTEHPLVPELSKLTFECELCKRLPVGGTKHAEFRHQS